MKGHHRLLLALEELWVFAFGWIPTPLGRLVRLVMWRWMFARCGSVRFNTGIGMVGCHNMRLGNQVRVGRNCILTAGNGKLELADQVSLSPGVHLCADGGSIFIGVKNKIGDFAESTRKDIKIPHLFIGEALKYRLILLTESQDIITIDGAAGTPKERRKDSVAEIGSMHGKRMDHFPR